MNEAAPPDHVRPVDALRTFFPPQHSCLVSCATVAPADEGATEPVTEATATEEPAAEEVAVSESVDVGADPVVEGETSPAAGECSEAHAIVWDGVHPQTRLGGFVLSRCHTVPTNGLPPPGASGLMQLLSHKVGFRCSDGCTLLCHMPQPENQYRDLPRGPALAPTPPKTFFG